VIMFCAVVDEFDAVCLRLVGCEKTKSPIAKIPLVSCFCNEPPIVYDSSSSFIFAPRVSAVSWWFSASFVVLSCLEGFSLFICAAHSRLLSLQIRFGYLRN
jgi:hypothetical protein